MARIRQFIVRKYVMAKSASDAIKKEKNYRADEVWIDEAWMKENPLIPPVKIGFNEKK